MKRKRIMIAAPKSGSGKTTITCALLQSLKNRGEDVVSYKCGPDYIDPMFHTKVIGIPSRNLDTFFTDERLTQKLLWDSMPESGFAVMEGVMGLFDGLGGIREEGSSYHLANVTGTPIVLVVDAKGMGRSIIPILAGFLAYDKENLIRGVILNRISKGYFDIIKPLIEGELEIAVLGFLPEQDEFRVGNRHLGLILPDELMHIREQLQEVSRVFDKNVSIPLITEIAESAEEPENKGNRIITSKGSVYTKGISRQNQPIIAIARDEAFCFYYTENLELLQSFGATLRYFSPLHDSKLPDNCHGILIGGGYPELYAARLSENKSMKSAIRQAINCGVPVVAECGGFLYLHSAMRDEKGDEYEMAGVLPGTCFYTGKSIRFGYIELEELQSRFLPPDSRLRGHEFHYYDSTDSGSDVLAIKPVTKKSYSCIMEGENFWFGFPHLYYPSNPVFAESFVAKAEKYRRKTEQNNAAKK